MATCNPDDLNININAPAASGSFIPGFGIPSAPVFSGGSYPSGFPENLQNLYNNLAVLLPPGAVRAPLSANGGKQVLDVVLKLLDQVSPFLMAYKFFLPVLNIIVCIIEILCALSNPFKVIRAVRRLLRNCIPQFLALFPPFALPVLILSLLNIIIEFAGFIISQAKKMFEMLLKNISVYQKAIGTGDSASLKASATKFAQVLCSFQNYFVVLTAVVSVIQTIKDIISFAIKIPPCSTGSESRAPDVCPKFVQKSSFTSLTGNLRYYSTVNQKTLGNNISNVRNQYWQFFDNKQGSNIVKEQMFSNIFDAYDITTPGKKPVFFPTDSTYNASTDPLDSPYYADIRFFYKPSDFNRVGEDRFVRIKNLILTKVPTRTLIDYNLNKSIWQPAVLQLTGGQVYEDDGETEINGFTYINGIAIDNGQQGTLETFVNKPDELLDFTDLTTSNDKPSKQLDIIAEYTFYVNQEVLYNKNKITAACCEDLSTDIDTISTLLTSELGYKASLLSNLNFPDYTNLIDCVNVGFDQFRQNISVEGVALFQSTLTTCVNKSIDDSTDLANELIPIAIDVSKSSFAINPRIQFINKNIDVSVTLSDGSGNNIFKNINSLFANKVSKSIVGKNTFGNISEFTFDQNTGTFKSQITSPVLGGGNISVMYDNNYLSTISIPADLDQQSSAIIQNQIYSFVGSAQNIVSNSSIDNEQVIRDESDVGKDG